MEKEEVDLRFNVEDLHHSIDIKEEQFSEPEREIEKLPKEDRETKEEWEYTEFNLEDLHHSIDIKEEPPLFEFKGKLFRCEVCGFETAHKNSWINHSRIHTGEKPFACELCTCKCIIKRNLTRHMMTHTGEKPFGCNLCDLKFTRQETLNFHLQVHTGKRMVYTCETCGHEYLRKAALRRHIMASHPPKGEICNSKIVYTKKWKELSLEKPTKIFICEICGYQCCTKRTLQRHLLIHTGEKPLVCKIHNSAKTFACDMCNYESSSRRELKVHMIMHFGKKPFICEICSRSYTSRSILKRHMGIHTGEKPFACATCDYKTARKHCLRKHIVGNQICKTNIRKFSSDDDMSARFHIQH